MRVCTARWSSTTFCAISDVWDSTRPWSRAEGRLSPASPDGLEAWMLRKNVSQDWNTERETGTAEVNRSIENMDQKYPCCLLTNKISGHKIYLNVFLAFSHNIERKRGWGMVK